MTAIAARLHLPSERNRGSVPGFLAALLMHAALIGSMWFAVQWKTSVSAPATAELWELPSVEQTTPPPTPTPAPVPETPAPPPPQEAPTPKPDIAEKHEKARKPEEAPHKEEAPKKEKKPKPSPAQPTAQEMRRQQAEADKRHEEELKRLSSQAGTPSQAPASVSAGPISQEWAARIKSAVLANLNFAVPEGVSPAVYAAFRVDLLPDGEQASEPLLVHPSGLAGFDEAARRAILRTNPFPRKSNGTVDRTVTLELHPQDVR
jgi:colicin import membrane protein